MSEHVQLRECPDRRAGLQVDSEAMSTPAESEQTAGDESPTMPSLDHLAEDLVGVERALERLEDGSYWTDEVTGEPLADEALAADPTTRRAAPPADAPGA